MTSTSSTPDALTIVDRYVALWNEADPTRRRVAIVELFTPDAEHILEAPEEMRSAARHLGFPTLTLSVHGHDELEFRVSSAYDEFVGSGNYRFRARGNGARLGTILQFGWEMVATELAGQADSEPAAVGLEVVALDGSGRIHLDHQFIVA